MNGIRPATICAGAPNGTSHHSWVNDFRRLIVWQRAHEAALETYRVTRAFPASERYALVSQMRRAAASVASNIVESCGRGTRKDEARFLAVAAGSAKELEYQALLARDLGLLSPGAYQRLRDLTIETQRMLVALLRRARASDH